MNSFGEYLRSRREQLGLPLIKVTAELDIDTSMLSKIEISECVAKKEMLPTLVMTLEVQEIKIEIKFIKTFSLVDLSELKFLKSGLEETLNTIKSRK